MAERAIAIRSSRVGTISGATLCTQDRRRRTDTSFARNQLVKLMYSHLRSMTIISHCLSNMESVANCVCKLQALRAQLKRCSCVNATVGLLEYENHRLREMETESLCPYDVNRICMYQARRNWRFAGFPHQPILLL